MRWETNVCKVYAYYRHRRRRFLPMAKARGFRAENAVSRELTDARAIAEADRQRAKDLAYLAELTALIKQDDEEKPDKRKHKAAK